MKEYNLNEENITEVPKAGSALPAKVGVWSKVKGFLFQEINFNTKRGKSVDRSS